MSVRLTEEIAKLLTAEIINKSSSHENAPPGHDCGEECGVGLEDQIAASNPFCSPIRSGGKKHKKCMDCWEDWSKNLAAQILAHLASLAPEEAGKSIESIIQANFDCRAVRFNDNGQLEGTDIVTPIVAEILASVWPIAEAKIEQARERIEYLEKALETLRYDCDPNHY